MKQLTDYEQTLLLGWEEVHNKGQLSLWLLLALKEGAKHMAQIKEFMQAHITSLSPDDKSMYRALRRFRDSELIDFKTIPSSSGPDLKQYYLTDVGHHVLSAFIARNIDVYYKSAVRTLIEGKG